VARPALTQFFKHEDPNFDPYTSQGNGKILQWTGYITYASALCGGVFGLLGGMLTDRFGRKRILFLSVLLYALSPVAAAFSTSPLMLLILRCTTFIGVCVEFVAATAWLAELFSDQEQREKVLGYTQAFASVGGLMVSGMYRLLAQHSSSLPAVHETHDAWRYLLISGLIPAIPLIFLLPFLPESPVWREKKRAGTLKRTSLRALFIPQFRRTTIVSTLMFACTMGAAFGALQLAPQIVPSLAPQLKELKAEGAHYNKLNTNLKKAAQDSPEAATIKTEMKATQAKLAELGKAREAIVGGTQLFQELGGLAGRCVLAILALFIISRRWLLRIFLLPGLIVMPLVFGYAGVTNLSLFQWGLAAAGFVTVAQMSFWGNYLPRVYPTHLRGTGEGFAANVGGRMFGTTAQVVATQIAALFATGLPLAAAIVGFSVFLIATIASFWLPEPKSEDLPE
ncbi:MAG TPA: MFS transporter, partial [Pirellulales bacterium]|nr:MFS transporter [Pirellulales bacterium]